MSSYFVIFLLFPNGIRSYMLFFVILYIYYFFKYCVPIPTYTFIACVKTRECKGSSLSTHNGLVTPGFSIFSLFCLYLVYCVSFDLVLWVANHLYGAGVLTTGPLTLGSQRLEKEGFGTSAFLGAPAGLFLRLSEQDVHAYHATYLRLLRK